MDTVILAIISVTLFVILGSVYLEMRRQAKPKIAVYFPNGSKRISYRAKEEANVAIHIKNIGRFGLPKPCATTLAIFVYTRPTFLLKEFRWVDQSSPYVKQAPSGGIFRDMHYMGGKTTLSLFHKEEEVITVAMQMPEKTGNYPVKVPISSDQGDLGIHKLEIIVT